MAKNLKELYPPKVSVVPKKYSDGNGGTITVLPSPIIKRDLTDYKYGKDIDEKVVTLAVALAEKMAISIIRETNATQQLQLETFIDKITQTITGSLIAKMPAQQVVIQQTAQEAMPQIKQQVKDFEFDTNIGHVDRSGGMVLKGQGTKISKTNDSIDDTLDALDKLNL